MAWPVKAKKVRYCGLDLWIMPLMTDPYPAIAVNRPSNILRTECELAVMRFLSTLCWIDLACVLPCNHVNAVWLSGGDATFPTKFLGAVCGCVDQRRGPPKGVGVGRRGTSARREKKPTRIAPQSVDAATLAVLG